MAVVFDQNFPEITLYTAQSPDGIKISITLEMLGLATALPYQVKHLDSKLMKEGWFLELNPNGQIPALVDTFTDNKPIRIFESGSIMLYLIEQYDRNHTISYPKGSPEHYETVNWLFFQNAGIGPMQSQATHFVRDTSEKHNYSIERYVTETKRLYGILDKHFASQKGEHSASIDGPWLVGDRCTIADIAHIGWVMRASWAKVDIGNFPHLKDWEMRMMKKDGVQRGLHVPETFEIEDLRSNGDQAANGVKAK
ncbi:hypothetical protein MMC18_002274 [Xylographa bjoerkii]|nr:hypothetical protein [Xylographa bjoerkii]